MIGILYIDSGWPAELGTYGNHDVSLSKKGKGIKKRVTHNPDISQLLIKYSASVNLQRKTLLNFN